MGCWNGTCMISHLPIECGDEIKLVIIRRNRKEDGFCGSAYCYPNGIFVPSFLPLEGTYDDYGGIENINEDWNYNIITEYIKKNFQSIKVNGKEIKNFSIEDVLEGLKCGELEVYRELDKKRVEMAKKVIETYEKNGGFSSEKVEKEWRDIANTDVLAQWRKSNMSFVMIRKDVWDELCAGFVGEFYNNEAKSINDKDFYLSAREWCKRKFEKTLMLYKSGNTSKKDLVEFNEVFHQSYAGSGQVLAADEYSKYMFNKESDKEDVLKQWTETEIINSILGQTRRGWMIQTGAGSQHTSFEEHLRLCKIVEKICEDKNIKE